MTTIETPVGPGVFISRWRTEGPVSSEVLAAWKEELDWPSWLSLAEAALFMDAPELLDTMLVHLTPGEEAVLRLVRRRWLGDTRLSEAIEEALTVVRDPATATSHSRADCGWSAVWFGLSKATWRGQKTTLRGRRPD